MLTWLSDHSSDVFFVGTCNDISKLPPEFSRAERFDGIFFLDTPGTAEKAKIWPIHLNRYGLTDGNEKKPEDREWTGAEIQNCCRLAALLPDGQGRLAPDGQRDGQPILRVEPRNTRRGSPRSHIGRRLPD